MRRALQLLLGGSALVWLLSSIFWMRSRTTGDSLNFAHQGDTFSLISNWREVGFRIEHWLPGHWAEQTLKWGHADTFNDAPDSPFFSRFYPDPSKAPLSLRLGFGHERGTWSLGSSEPVGPPQTIGTSETWFVPWCSVWLISGILPVHYAFIGRRRRLQSKRRLAGCCAACGYDLRASKERCPECGASFRILPSSFHASTISNLKSDAAPPPGGSSEQRGVSITTCPPKGVRDKNVEFLPIL